jgi:hypothetical protein
LIIVQNLLKQTFARRACLVSYLWGFALPIQLPQLLLNFLLMGRASREAAEDT